jgi:riboflavin kinase/FMN adenylyltransferase
LPVNDLTMIIHQGYENLHFKNPVVTLGIFDGVHRGHRMVIDSLVSRAKELNGESVIITFYPHPRQVLSENKEELFFLTSLEEKTMLIEKTGVDHLVIIQFDRNFSNRESCEFVKDVLIGKIGTKHLIVGFNHHFGKRGEGDFDTIKKCAESLDFNVEKVRALNSDSVIISSSAIRNALINGRLGDANELLGYHYFMNGSIVKGKELGRKIGFPTANIKPDYSNKLIPKDGVYAVKVEHGGKEYSGVMSIGMNPTVNMDPRLRTIEVNIFNFDMEIYGEKVCIVFMYRLRDEKKFANLKDLAAQIELDKSKAIQLLG